MTSVEWHMEQPLASRISGWIALAMFLVTTHAYATNIASYGGCKGVDDTAAIKAAIKAAKSGDHNITIPCMAQVSSQILLSGSGLTLTAAAPGDGIRQTAPLPVLLLVKHCNKCSVDGLTFDAGGFASRVVQVQDCRATSITGNHFSNGNGGSAYVYAVRNTGDHYNSNVIIGSRGAERGLWIGNGGSAASTDIEHGALIEDNFITRTAATGIVYTGDDGLIQNNTVIDTRGAGIALSSPFTYAETTNTTVKNNILLGNRFHGMQSDAWNGAKTTHITVLSNIARDNGHSGIYAANVSNWSVRDNDVRGNPDGGVILYNAATVLTNGNNGSVVNQDRVRPKLLMPR